MVSYVASGTDRFHKGEAMEVAKIQLTRGHVALIDAHLLGRELWVGFRDGFEWRGTISSRSWIAKPKPHTVYAEANISTNNKLRTLRLHRLVMCAAGHEEIDHRDGDGLNCVRSNLRYATLGQNAANRIATPGLTSQFKGVAIHKQTGKFEAYLRHDRKKRHLGLFATEIEAAQRYDAESIQVFGEFALLNFPASAVEATT